MTPLENRAIAMQRRPGAVLLVYAYRAVASWLVGAPLALAVGATGLASFPSGDRRLFEDGGLYLIEVIRVGQTQLAASLQNAGLAFFVAVLGAFIPFSALLVALSHEGRLRMGPWLGKAVTFFPTLVLVSGLTLFLQGVCLFASSLLATGVGDALAGTWDERRVTFARLGAYGVGLIAVALLGLANDLARAAVVRHDASALRALRVGFRTLIRRPGSVAVGWLTPAVWSVVAVFVGAVAVGYFDVSKAGAHRWFVTLVVHQLVIATLVTLRATWLARALRLTGSDGERQPKRE